MDEWEALEDAMQQERWPEAAKRARSLLDAWRDAKGAVLWLASGEVEEGAKSFEALLSSLVSLLESPPIDTDAVKEVRGWLRVFLPPEGT